MKERIDWVDIVKGVAILSVVIGHSISSRSILYKTIFSFHMPIFFILAAYTSNFDKELNYFYLGKIKRLLLPYFFAINFDFIDWLILGRYLTGDTSHCFNLYSYITKQYAIGLGQISTWAVVNPVGVIWFIPCLFCAELIFYFVLKFCEKNNNKIFLYSFVLCLLGYAISRYIFLLWSLDIALFAQIFLFTGYYLKQKKVFNDNSENKITYEYKVSLLIIWFVGILSYPIIV